MEKNKIEELDDMPELEDLSEDLNKLRVNRQAEEGDIKVNVINPTNTADKTNSVKVDSNQTNKNTKPNTVNNFKFKKGFFLQNKEQDANSNQNKDKKENKVVDISHIKSNPENTIKEKLVNNVKSDIKSNIENNSKSSILNDIVTKKDEWLNQELLNKIAKKPNLFKSFMDPRFADVIALMQRDPQKAMQQYGQYPEFRTFMQEFSEIMAEHFTKLGAEQKNTQSTGNKDTGSSNLPDFSNDNEVQEILNDKKVQAVIQKLQMEGKLDVNELSRDVDLGKKVKILIDKGLFKLQRESELNK